jgi:hypothetical protein
MEAEEEEGKDALVGLDEDHLIQTISDVFFSRYFVSIVTFKAAPLKFKNLKILNLF